MAEKSWLLLVVMAHATITIAYATTTMEHARAAYKHFADTGVGVQQHSNAALSSERVDASSREADEEDGVTK